MPQSKLSRHTLAFGLIVTASLALYPAARSGMTWVIWGLLGLLVGAALIALTTR